MQIYRYPSPAAEKKMKSIIDRTIDFRKADVQAVTQILGEVKKNGDQALIEYCRKFDAPQMTIGCPGRHTRRDGGRQAKSRPGLHAGAQSRRRASRTLSPPAIAQIVD